MPIAGAAAAAADPLTLWQGPPILKPNGTLSHAEVFKVLASISLTLKDLMLFGEVHLLRNNDGQVSEIRFKDLRSPEVRQSFYFAINNYIRNFLIDELHLKNYCPTDKIARAIAKMSQDAHAAHLSDNHKGKEQLQREKAHKIQVLVLDVEKLVEHYRTALDDEVF